MRKREFAMQMRKCEKNDWLMRCDHFEEFSECENWFALPSHYRCEDRKKKSTSWELTFVPLDRSWLPLREIPDHNPQKQNRSARRCIWRYRCQPGVWNCQILNQVVESQLFTFLWNGYPQWLSDIQLIQISAFFSFLFLDWPLFLCWRANRYLKFSRNLQTPENDHVHICSVWSDPTPSGFLNFHSRHMFKSRSYSRLEAPFSFLHLGFSGLLSVPEHQGRLEPPIVGGFSSAIVHTRARDLTLFGRGRLLYGSKSILWRIISTGTRHQLLLAVLFEIQTGERTMGWKDFIKIGVVIHLSCKISYMQSARVEAMWS